MNEKEQWIIEYISNLEGIKMVNVLNADFVDKYVEKFNVKCEVKRYGANKCKNLSSTLSSMYKKRLLTRCSMGLRSGAYQDGFPRWVYCYELI